MSRTLCGVRIWHAEFACAARAEYCALPQGRSAAVWWLPHGGGRAKQLRCPAEQARRRIACRDSVAQGQRHRRNMVLDDAPKARLLLACVVPLAWMGVSSGLILLNKHLMVEKGATRRNAWTRSCRAPAGLPPSAPDSCTQPWHG